MELAWCSSPRDGGRKLGSNYVIYDGSIVRFLLLCNQQLNRVLYMLAFGDCVRGQGLQHPALNIHPTFIVYQGSTPRLHKASVTAWFSSLEMWFIAISFISTGKES